ncbi:unnamed protein product [Brassicogethes aeneus]|uniref:Uncharacterized protein n=1 Tax=Brassicogethes aeneus TaxID=1431903 RepID=A0A9P0FLD7_BRAAE|nr:unnamed protein product [Brassicogethes aeneus]
MAQEVPSPSRATMYFCPECKKSIKKLPQLQNKVQKTEEELKETKEQGDTTVKNLEELKIEVDSLKGSVEQIRKENDEIRKEITLKKLEMKVETIKTPEVTNIEPALFELEERRRRATNVLIFSVEESGKDNMQEKAKEDQGKVAGLFSKMNLRLPEMAKVYRLAKERADRKRPLKVILPTKEEALSALKYRKVLEENQTGIYIKSDQTEVQRKFLKKLLAELEKLKAEETWLKESMSDSLIHIEAHTAKTAKIKKEVVYVS